MRDEQKVRAILFYLSVLVFFAGLPFILSVSLGYKFDRRSFKFTKAGLIVLKTQPPGATVYLENKLLNDRTPATINELLPGTYRLKLELDRHYPWSAEVRVEAGKVTRLERIILFPTRPNIKQLNKERFYSFWLDEEKGSIYYVNPQERLIYKSDLDGSNYEEVGSFLETRSAPQHFILSPDRKKLAYFNKHEVGINYLEPHTERPLVAPNFIIAHPGNPVTKLFWHSDSYHLVLITNRTIEVLESKVQSRPLVLVNLNKENSPSFYDSRTDILYFVDSEVAGDGNIYDNLYRLELNPRIFPFQQLIRIKPGEE